MSTRGIARPEELVGGLRGLYSGALLDLLEELFVAHAFLLVAAMALCEHSATMRECNARMQASHRSDRGEPKSIRGEAASMRIGTYNVLGFQGFGRVTDRADLGSLEAWVEILGRLDCDVLALQEIGPDSERVVAIGRGLGMEVTILPSPLRWPGALLSRLPRRSGEATRIFNDTPTPIGDGDERGRGGDQGQNELFSRSAGAVCLELRGDTGLWVVSLHAHPHELSIRLREARRLREQLVEIGAASRPAIVVGDFNSERAEGNERGEPMHAVLDELGFTNVFEEAPAPRTHLGDREQTAVDHIYLSPALRPTLRRARAIDDAGFAPDAPGGWSFSDHLPVVAELAWPAS